jgi:hypothetical protein
MAALIDSSRVTAHRTIGPRGGFTQWAAYLDGVLYVRQGEPIKRDTMRAARMALLDYMRRHPDKF